MSLSFLGLEDLYKINAIPTLVLSLGLLGLIGILLTLGRRLDSAMRLERFGIPIALLIGALGSLITHKHFKHASSTPSYQESKKSRGQFFAKLG